MAEILKRHKALSVSPLKASQTLGAALAFLGFHRAIPMLHGSQGCTAFGKVFFVRHFREPIPLQTSAMDQISSVMGADDNLVEGLATLCSKNQPALVGVPTTGLAETQGSDVQRAVREFRARHPEHAAIPVVALAAPDFSGCLESGFAAATRAIIDTLVPEAAVAGTFPGHRPRQVNLLVGASLTPGDIEELKEIVELLGLRPVVIPDLSDSLDGHLSDQEFTPLTLGGTPVAELATLGNACATLVIGPSMAAAADLLRERTGCPDHRFDHLMGLDAVDRLVDTLSRLAREPVPERLERQRAQLQDAMLDTHFMLGLSRIALAADPDLLCAFTDLLQGVGAEVAAAVAPASAPVLARLPLGQVKIGDLDDLERLIAAREASGVGGAELLIGSSHALESARRLGLPLLRAGFPQYDRLGGCQRTWIGYRGTRQTLFELANLLLGLERGEIHPYRSVYAQRPEYPEATHEPSATTARHEQHH
jgi:nitrogenase molybdenum-iron protein NifN